MKKLNHLIIFSFFIINAFSQANSVEWRVLPIEKLPPDKRPLFYQVLCSSSGSLILSSTHGLIDFQGFRINFPAVSIIANDKEKMEKVKDPHIIDDNGIGRELSMKNKPQYESPHQSKGIGLTKSRLELDKLLNEREDKIFMIDKEDEHGKPDGTKVIISFKEV